MPFNNIINLKRSNFDALFRSYRPMLIVLLICGYHFPFYKRNVILTAFGNIYCVTLVSVVIFATTMCCETHEILQIWSLIEYTLSVFIILCSKNRIILFFHKMSDIDCYLRINSRHYTSTVYKLLIFVCIVWGVRIIYTYLYCLSYPCYNILLLYAVKQVSLLSLDLNRVWRCLLFEGIRYRLRILRVRLQETPEYDYYLYVKNNRSVKENRVKFCLFLYRSIADMVDIVSPELHASLFLSAACSLPKLIINVYHILTIIEGHEPVTNFGFVIMHLVQISLLLFSPFVTVELFAVEVEKMRMYLMHTLMDHPDSPSKEDIEMFLRYTELRTFRYKIWRMIPINAALPLELINLCTSYVIVIINFTHLYG